jgi:CDP-glycerol glycerophosphotransferase
MNKYIKYLTRFSIFLFAFPATIISLFIKRDKKLIIFTSFLNKQFDSNSKYLFIWFIKNIKSYRCFFVINDNILRNTLNKEIGNYFIETKSLSGKIFALRAGIWVISSLTIPVGGFFMNYKRQVIHLGHGTPLKKFGLLTQRLSLIQRIYYVMSRTNISYSVASSHYFVSIIAGIFGLSDEKVLVAGQARNDKLCTECDIDMSQFGSSTKTKNILYAPTFRSSGQLKLFPFKDFSCQILSDFLVQNDVNIFLRMHPSFDDKINSELLKIPRVHIFSGKLYAEIMDYLNKFDLLITDYSSICFDYLLLNKPMIFLPYDYDQYNKDNGFTVPYNEFTPGYKPKTMKDFISVISECFNNKDKYRDERNRINAICNAIQKENCENIVKVLYDMNILYE